MSSCPQYSESEDYKAIMEYDPQRERADELELKLLRTQIELTFTQIRCEMFERMYNKLESISNIV